MEFEQALDVINTVKYARFRKYLSDVETVILKGAWQSQTYEKIAENSSYSESYLKRDAGPQLWARLSKAFGESVSKTNFRTAIERQWAKIYASKKEVVEGKTLAKLLSQENKKTRLITRDIQGKISNSQSHTDWGNAIHVRHFFERAEELTVLKNWIQADRCQLLALLGMGGIGKTTIAVRLAEQIQGDFDYVIWRSLRNMPSANELLINIIQFISGQDPKKLPQKFDEQLLALITYLRSFRCLIILDNVESVLKSGDRKGSYHESHQEYEQLFNCLAETSHSSCLVFTSREWPKGLTALEGSNLSFRYMQLSGLSDTAGKKILQHNNIFTELHDQQSTIIQDYAGNPFALKIVASNIHKIFDGNIQGFLEVQNNAPFIFDDIRDLFSEQIGRLTNLQQIIMYWLSLIREPLTINQLRYFFPSTLLIDELLYGLESLKSRSLTKKTSGKFSLDKITADYTNNYFIEVFFQEITNERFMTLKKYLLINENERDEIKTNQIKFIVRPVLKKLFLHFGSPRNVDCYLSRMLNIQRIYSQMELECITGNILCIHNYLKGILDDDNYSSFRKSVSLEK
ncbi:NB-ARC domain-containing protein [Acaryochloris sp. IP29b_bin.148]|uniref:NB-ARC domain-containing protein n=1 Tax=Acaryochloris sp. IP29b_bin.148 TaxID=2969218 RepID=UPI00260E59DE|nr:NB-ARC domain-containing protein [Acaryochloris sp. IP29b_bin.148]